MEEEDKEGRPQINGSRSRMMNKNIIINELLTFLQNKIDVLDELSIIQICATNFSDSEIENGKQLVYSSLADGVRCPMRKGEDKNKKNLKDIIKVLKESDPDNQPVFVARDLNRLPPVSFDHVDVCRLLRPEKGSIEVFDLGSDGESLTKVVRLSRSKIVSAAVDIVKTLEASNFKPVIPISAVEDTESEHLNLVAVTQTG